MKFRYGSFVCALAALFTILPAASGCENDQAALLPPYDEEEPTQNETIEIPSDEKTTDEPDVKITENPISPPAEELEEETETAPTPPEEENTTAQYVSVTASGLNVRSGAGTEYSVIGQAEKNTLLALEGQIGSWYKTYYLGRVAYVSARADYTAPVSMEAASAQTEAVIAEGLKLLGTPYVYGAVRLHDGKGNMLKNFNVSEFDCSSLMQYIFYRGAGVMLDVTTRTQVSQGQAVAKNELKRGDLIFFTNASRQNKTGTERIGHVALYLGNNYILHTASDYAKIEQISAQRWSYYITTRRMI